MFFKEYYKNRVISVVNRDDIIEKAKKLPNKDLSNEIVQSLMNKKCFDKFELRKIITSKNTYEYYHEDVHRLFEVVIDYNDKCGEIGRSSCPDSYGEETHCGLSCTKCRRMSIENMKDEFRKDQPNPQDSPEDEFKINELVENIGFDKYSEILYTLLDNSYSEIYEMCKSDYGLLKKFMYKRLDFDNKKYPGCILNLKTPSNCYIFCNCCDCVMNTIEELKPFFRRK